MKSMIFRDKSPTETAFYKVIDVVDDGVTESAALSRLREISKPNALANLKNLKVCEPADFNPL